MVSVLLAAAAFGLCAATGLWLLRSLPAAKHATARSGPALGSRSQSAWIAPPGAAALGTHVWGGHAQGGLLRTPAGSAAIIVGPPKAGKTRKVIAPTLAFWEGPALVTSTKGDILATSGHRALRGPVAVYDPTGSLGQAELSVGFSPLARCGSWDGAVEVAAALLSPASADASVRHGEHFATAARALLAPLLHAAAISDGGMDALGGWLSRMELSEPAEILRQAGALIAVQELSGVGSQASGDYRTSVLGTAQVALAWSSRQSIRQSADPNSTPQLDLRALLQQNGTLYVISPSRIQQELAPLIAALIDALCAIAIDTAISSPAGRLDPPLLLALDEVANIAPIRSLPRLLSEGIQQGIVPILGVQDMSQLRARFGEHETATMWSTPALRLILAGLADPYTAQLVSEACGEQLIWRAQVGENTSTSKQPDRHGHTYTGGDSHTYSQQRERIIQPSDLRAMSPGRALALPQGQAPIPTQLFDAAPGMSDTDWREVCEHGLRQLC